MFGLANAGIELDAAAFERAVKSPVTWGIVIGLVVGKLVGIAGATAIAVRLGLAGRPRGVGGVSSQGAAALAGIGFTVSLFVSELAFGGEADVCATPSSVCSSRHF